MLSLLDLISQNQPHFQTHEALLVIGLQNDFIRSDGKLPVDTRNGFIERIQSLIPKFRQFSANVIWIQTLYEADRLASDPTTGGGDAVVVGGVVDRVDSSTDDDEDLPKDLIQSGKSRSSRHKQRALDLFKRVSARKRTAIPKEVVQAIAEDDEELFLLKSSKNGPACLPDTPGADFVDSIKSNIDRSDMVLRTTNYSAFLGTSLLLNLRAKLVTELYICGCITNISVLATVVDAARHGIKINVVEDCLGFRKQARHDEAIKRMIEFFDANLISSAEILSRDSRDSPVNLEQPPNARKESEDSSELLEAQLNRLKLGGNDPQQQENSHNASYDSPAIAINGRQRTLSDASVAESRATTDTKLSDEQFAEKLAQGAKLSHREESKNSAAKPPNLVKSKIRMRSRSDKSNKDANNKKDEDKKSKAEAPKRGEPTLPQPAAETAPLPVAKVTKIATSADPVRAQAIAKAESSDKLRESSSRHDRLKSSISHPSLSSSKADKERSSPSRVRLALSRSPKSDTGSKQEVPNQPKSPIKPTDESTAAPHPSTDSPAMSKKLQSLANLPTLGPGDHIAEGDSRIIHDFFPPDYYHPTDPSKPLRDVIFYQLYNEVRWQKMLHQQGEVPRLVCCQGDFGADGSMPVYRHPTDQALPLLHFSPKVKVIRKQAEKLVGHPLNHVLIQLYRSGNDYISEHSDKTLDIVKGSSIVNVSFGAQRTMRLRTKKSAKSDAADAAVRNTQRITMPHNSMFVLGLESNKKWLHGINADKRISSERSEAEKAFSGIRISLTFRHIGTFLDAEYTTIWGQGATCKEQREASEVINDVEDENEKMVRAFSKENHEADFDWEEWYGDGFDVLHFQSPPEDLPIFFASHYAVEQKMIQVFLWESNIKHILLEAPTLEKRYELDRQITYRDNDINHTEISFPVPILLYLDRYNPLDRDERGRVCTSGAYETLVMVDAMRKYWVNRHVPTMYSDFVTMLRSFEARYRLETGPFIAGRRFSIGDCVAWPVLDDIIEKWEAWNEEDFPALTQYYKVLWRKKKSVSKLRKILPEIRKEPVAQADDSGKEANDKEEAER